MSIHLCDVLRDDNRLVNTIIIHENLLYYRWESLPWLKAYARFQEWRNNNANSPLLSRLGSLNIGLENFTQALENFSKALKRLETWLEPLCSKFLRIVDQVLRTRLQAPVNFLLSDTVCNEIHVALHGCQCWIVVGLPTFYNSATAVHTVNVPLKQCICFWFLKWHWRHVQLSLRNTYIFACWWLNGHGYNSSNKTAIETCHEINRIINLIN